MGEEQRLLLADLAQVANGIVNSRGLLDRMMLAPSQRAIERPRPGRIVCALSFAWAIGVTTTCVSVETTDFVVATAVRCEPRNSMVSATGLAGPEDITIDHSTGFAYISADHRRKEGKSGGIYRYAAGSCTVPSRKRQVSKVLPNTGEAPGGFHPHGISLFEGPCTDPSCAPGAPTKRLFIINHRIAPDSEERLSDVDIFDIADGDTLRHVETIAPDSKNWAGRRPLNLNDVVAIGSNRFYATDNGRGTLLSSIFGKGAVVYYDGTEFHEVISGLKFANGIAFHSEARKLYVSTSSGKTLYVYDASNPQHPEEQGTYRISLDGLLDNIEWESRDQDALLVAGHDSTWAFFRHSKWKARTSPSSVWRIAIGPGGLPAQDAKAIRLIYQHAGESLPGISVAAPYGKCVLLGAVFVDRFLDCQYAPDAAH